MYSVLIVDDEPLILSGVKHIINWEEEGCYIAGTERDGKRADAFIVTHMPDIVICDINMPGMNGIDLLKKARTAYPDVVFIMLTCLEEFELVKEAIRYGAIDYILKTELDAENLKHSIIRAEKESDARRRISGGNTAKELRDNDDEEIRSTMLSRLYLAEPLEQNHIAYFRKQHMDTDIALMQVLLTLVRDSDTPFDCERFKEQVGFSIDIIEEVISSFFPSHYLITRSQVRFFSISFYLYHVDAATYQKNLEKCTEKIKKTLNDIVGIQGDVIATDVVHDIKDLETAKAQITTLKDIYFVTAHSLTAKDIGSVTFTNASLEAVTDRVIEAIHDKQKENFAYFIDMFRIQLKKEPVSQSTVIWRMEEMISGATKETEERFVAPLKALRQALSYVSSVEMLSLWIDRFKAVLAEIWNDSANTQLTIADKAQRYIDAHVQQRIYLSDVAEAVHVSPGYLSSVFSKQCGISVVEYINKAKTEEAMRLLGKGNLRILDIGETLGFENSYYFSKVFRKYAHMSPSDYQKKVQSHD